MKKKTLFLNICMLIITICMTPINLKCSDHTKLEGETLSAALIALINTSTQMAITQLLSNNAHDIIASHISNSNNDDATANQENPNIKCHPCPECAKTFKRSCDLERHTEAIHTKERHHKCDICDTAFNDPSCLRRHQKTHNGKTHTCNVCNKVFNDLSNLNRHLRIHNNEKPYECSYPGCNKKFSDASHRKSHMNVHTDEKPHTCSVCHKPFKRLNGLKKHANTHTRDLV